MKINHPDWTPCYLNPDFNEILELARSQWDTCRIAIALDSNDMVIASGYGNTHTSILERYRLHLNKRRTPSTDTFILYHEEGKAYLNLEDVTGKRKARIMDNLDLFGPHAETVQDLIRESDLAL